MTSYDDLDRHLIRIGSMAKIGTIALHDGEDRLSQQELLGAMVDCLEQIEALVERGHTMVGEMRYDERAARGATATEALEKAGKPA
ncbi:hypothetical protein [Mangrovicoccus ximenensis]|uniref:hypothetical protein n=1 Tax=Mangrovicoccus ximenensis TaxID=1911570 RepID=UPI000D393C7D|nr:hypothetical protein [Mangrovicoccus ximenensis]